MIYVDQDDGYAQRIHYRTFDNCLSGGWIDNIGIWLEETSCWSSSSLYLDANGIFFFAEQDKQYKGFIEFKDVGPVYQLPFKHIINFDFREFIEYEPVIYIKYRYSSFKKLYGRTIQIKRKLNADNKYNTGCYEVIRSEGLDSKNLLKKYNYFYYRILQIKIVMKNFCKDQIESYKERH